MSLYNPTKEQVREFFCQTWQKHQTSMVLTPLESIAARWMVEHPEYHHDFEHIERALEKEYGVEGGQTNPFLHLSMHLSLTEMIQVDQPKGIQTLYKDLSVKYDTQHAAQHQMMDCLGEVLWESQRNGTMPDMQRFLTLMQARL